MKENNKMMYRCKMAPVIIQL